MQLFIRDPSGKTTAVEASSPLELQSQVFDTLNIPPFDGRLSHRSRTLDPSPASSFADLAIQPYSTLDLSFRLRGGGPKKRCAHVFVKTTSNSNTPSTSGVATPSTSTAAPAEVKAESDKEASTSQDQEMKVDSATVPSNSEPVLERCSSAALRMVGECTKCNKNFCGQHRLPEDHACPALQTFRKAAFEENMKKLNKEATFTNKISAF